MTKEKMEENIICLLGYCNNDVINSINDIFEEFTRTNVCIPKGKNRHPYADILHESIEMGNLQKRYQISYDTRLKTKWIDFDISISDEFRIKPSDSVFEYQWVLEEAFVGEIARTKFMTIQEHNEFKVTLVGFQRDEETKKVRK